MVLQRCGAASGLFLSDVSAYALTRRYAIWVAGSTLRVRALQTGRVRLARLPRLGRDEVSLAVADGVVYVGDASQSPARRWRVALA